jgi:hypothetical protein
MSADPVRYRQSLLDALTDDGLEELTLVNGFVPRAGHQI